MGSLWTLGALLLAGCGRLDFDPREGDGGAGDDASALGFCASQVPSPTRCADFDTGTDIAAGFKNNARLAGTVAYTASDRSAPNALLSHVGMVTSTTDANSASLDWDLGTASFIHYRADIFIAKRPDQPGIEMMSANMTINQVVFFSDIYVSDNGLNDQYIQERFDNSTMMFASMNTPLSEPVPIGTWFAMDWTLDFANHQVDLVFDGMTAKQTSATFADLDEGLLTVQVGLNFVQGAGSELDVKIDNVILDVH